MPQIAVAVLDIDPSVTSLLSQTTGVNKIVDQTFDIIV